MEVKTPVELDGQYRLLREAAGFVDRSTRGVLAVRGPDAAEYLQSQLTNDVEALAPGEGCYAALLDRKGHMRTDARVLRLAGDELWLDTEPVAIVVLREHLDAHRVGRRVEIDELTQARAILAVIGPAAAALTGTGQLAEHRHRQVEVGGVECLAVGTELGVDLIAEAGSAEALRGALTAVGICEVEEAAAEILRVEAGRPRFGVEMDERTIPQEAGITERAVSFDKGCYIGQETVARLHYKGKPTRHLRGLRLTAPVATGAVIRLPGGGRELGAVGTACLSPAHGPIALAIVRREATPGDAVEVDDGVAALVVELPFGAAP